MQATIATGQNAIERVYWQNGRLMRQTDKAWIGIKTKHRGMEVTEYFEGTGQVPFNARMCRGGTVPA